MTYDLIVIGGGPAGYLAAERAGQAGLHPLLIEKEHLGGVCLNEGCIPTKTMLYSAKICDQARNGKPYGVRAGEVTLDHGAVLRRKGKTVRKLVAGIRAGLKNCGADVRMGSAEILARDAERFQIRISSGSGNGAAGTAGKREADLPEEDAVVTGKHLLLATGSVPVIPSISGVAEGMENGTVLTSREILDLPEVPHSLVIVGGGIIGLEMASYFHSAGSKVTVVEMLDHIAGNTDREIAQILRKDYQKKGMTFYLNTRVTQVKDGAVVCESHDHGDSHGKTFSLTADRILLSIGREPQTAGLGLEHIGVELDHGRVRTDGRCCTNVPDVYAAGDINGISMLAHTAYREAEVAVNNILGKADRMQYHAVPSVIYTNPEVAGTGETEETAAAKGVDCKVVRLSMNYSGRYMAENERGDGICKVLTEKESQRIIGVHLIGNYSSEIIYGAALMIERGMQVQDIKKMIFPHPTVSEIIREAMFEL